MKIKIPVVHSLPIERGMKKDVRPRRTSLGSQETHRYIATGLHKEENKVSAVFLHPAMEKGSPTPRQYLNVGAAGQKGTENLQTCFKSILFPSHNIPMGKGSFHCGHQPLC